MVVAYLRVSTEKQFLANQREELLRFAEKNGLQIDKWYTETVSGSVRSKDRKLSGVLNRMQRGDSLIVTEISRLSRTMLEIMTILNSCIKKEIVLYSTKEGYAKKSTGEAANPVMSITTMTKVSVRIAIYTRIYGMN